jgi:SAM-dependent methyltransferase
MRGAQHYQLRRGWKSTAPGRSPERMTEWLWPMPHDRAPAFSTLSPSILEREDRLRVGRQLLAVLDHYLGAGRLAGRRVLDVGCSSGVITGLIAAAAGPTVGIDVDEAALAHARESLRVPQLEFRTMSAEALDFADGSFDVVICNQMYYWLDNPDRLMAEIARVLAPSGVCLFTTVNKYKLWEAQYRLPLLSVMPRPLADFCVRLAGKGDRFGCHYLSYWELSRLCNGFDVHRYTPRILKDPAAYRFTNLSMIGGLTRRLPLSWLEALEPLSPNLVWVLAKK